MILAFAALSALILSAWLTRRICDPGSVLHVLDHPNERSLHTRPVPRTGGVAIFSGMVAGILILLPEIAQTSRLFWLFMAMLLIAILSFVDDRRGISIRIRFLGHLASAAILLAGGFYLLEITLPGLRWTMPTVAGLMLSMLFLVWMVNLYNFMDGMDGFAGGMGAIGFGAFALLGWLADNHSFLAVNLVIASAVSGFLAFNFPPARIFMGDTGSVTLGLLAGGISLWGVRDGVYPVWVPLLVFSPFVVDATFTLLRRMLHGERVWQAHKTHYYQRLVQLGWGHRKTVLCEYALMLSCGISAVIGMLVGTAGQRAILIAWCIIYPILMWLVASLERRSKPIV